jgi:RHH-type proline utilization regulon transcriptional repressor/proline dehydrogenase/delta 1-pyrroline-5-carboxylate dehydrogenase
MYVPLGDLLPGMGYLVRRLLENTSNESFLRHTFFDHAEISALLEDPSRAEPPCLMDRDISLPQSPLPTEQPVEGLAVNLDY